MFIGACRISEPSPVGFSLFLQGHSAIPGRGCPSRLGIVDKFSPGERCAEQNARRVVNSFQMAAVWGFSSSLLEEAHP